MGAGRKTEYVVLQNKPPPQQTSNQYPVSARSIPKKDLAAVIFGCKHSTFRECVIKQLFGLPQSHIQYVLHVTPGMPLFLFNYSDKKLHGIYEAVSPGQLNINQYAWTLDGENVTPFPAQVRVKVRVQCRPLSEEQYKPILVDNYSHYEPNHFWFELDKIQTNKLLSLFSASPNSQSVAVPRTTAKWGTLFKQAVAPMVHQEVCNLGNGEGKQKVETAADQDVVEKQENVATSFEGKTWSSLFKPQSDSTSKKKDEDSNSEGFSNMSEDEASPAMSEAVCVDEAPPVMSEAICVDEAPPVMSEAIYVDEVPPLMIGVPHVDEAPDVSEVSQVTCIDEAPISSEVKYFIPSEVNRFIEEISSRLHSNYHTGVIKLIQAVGEMKAFQLDQTRKIQSLEQDLVETKKRVHELENFHRGSEKSVPSHSTVRVQDSQFKRTSQDSCHSILLVGGFSGSSWLQNLDLYLPSKDVMTALKPMSSIRPYASVVKLKDALYVLGGGYGTSWYDTVESYNLKYDQWMSCPPLNKKKGSMAGVSFCEKIYAIGGGNAADCFSEVEMLDVNIGKWVPTRSMAQERFGPAAAQLNGALYIVGGYDGREYLRSMERYDPRAYSWTKLRSMNTRRGCHSLIVLNEKLYAIGGYDGAQMVPTVEVFDPRVGSWTMLEPMKYARGYMGSVTVGNTIYAIGGMQENDEILDTVECYSEGEGWQLADLKAIGKRCFFQAVAL